MRFVFLCIVVSVLCLQVADGNTSRSGGKVKTRSGARAFAGTSGGGRGGSTVTTTTTVSTTSGGKTKTKTKKTTSRSRGGGGGGKREQKVELKESSVTSTSRATGSGIVKSSASASMTSDKSTGKASTTLDGKTKTVKKSKTKKSKTSTTKTEKSEKPDRKTETEGKKSSKKETVPIKKFKKSQSRKTKTKSERTTSRSKFGGRAKSKARLSARSGPKSPGKVISKDKKSTKPVKPSFDTSTYHTLPICRGLSKFSCCDDRTVVKIKSRTFCGCWGGVPDAAFCSYEVVTQKPLIVVRDIFADYSGESCRCPKLSEEKIRKCRGAMRRACCRGYDGGKTCRCNLPGDKCQYERISKSPLIWKHSRVSSLKCRC